MSVKYDINEKLLHYVDRRDLKHVSKLLADGANPTKVTSSGRSAIGYATFREYPEILEVLLKSCEEEYISFTTSFSCSSAKISRTDSETALSTEKTPEDMDGLQWDDEMTDENLTTVNSSDDEWTNLYKYYAKMFEQTGEILANSIKLRDPHCLDAFFYAPIHYAAAQGNIECLMLLLENGSPVDIRTHIGETPVHLAVKKLNVLEVLLRRNANPDCQTYNLYETPLHYAAKWSNVESVNLLVKYGANVNAIDICQKTPLIFAVENFNNDIACALIDLGAKLNLQDSKEGTALYYAVLLDNISVASYLLRKGARIFSTHYLLHSCIRFHRLPMAQLLINAGENVNLRDSAGCSPLYYAIKQCDSEAIDLLLKNGAERFSPADVAKEFHVAVQSANDIEQFKKVTRVLLAHGIQFDDYNYWRGTPVMMAMMHEKFKIAEFLIKEGADINKGRSENIVDNFLLARWTSNLTLLQLLVNAGIKLNPIPSNLKAPPWDSATANLEEWLAFTMRQPKTLQQTCRINIRNILIKNLYTKLADTQNYNDSRLFHLIRQLDIPVTLQKYLYEFDDLPKVSSSTDV